MRWNRLAAKVIERRRSWRGGTLTPGVNLIGSAFTEIGLESLRAMAKACLAGHIPFVVKDLDFLINTPQDDFNVAPYAVERLRHRCSDLLQQPLSIAMDPILVVARTRRMATRSDLVLGARAPAAVDASIVDEVWVASEFVAVAVRATKATIRKLAAISVSAGTRPTRIPSLAYPPSACLFLFSFDFNSSAKMQRAQSPPFRTPFQPPVAMLDWSSSQSTECASRSSSGRSVTWSPWTIVSCSIDGHLSREQL